MRMDYHQPESLDAALELLDRFGSQAALLAGGTALLIDVKRGELNPAHLVSLWGIPGLSGVGGNGALRIGALTTVTGMIESFADLESFQGLREAGLLLGGRQIQNVATVGGNICKASAGADLVPPLMCLDARLTLVGPKGERQTPLDGFLIGPDQTAMEMGEILTAIELPEVPPRTGTAFLKVMRRKAIDCSIVSVSARVTLAEDGSTCQSVRIGVAAAAPNPFRAKTAEAILEGQALTPELAQQAGVLARDEARPIDDVRASAAYRRLMVAALVERALLLAAERAGNGGE